MATTDDPWSIVDDSRLEAEPTRDDLQHIAIHEDTSFQVLVAALNDPHNNSTARKTLAVQWLVRHSYYNANRPALRECGAVDALRRVVDGREQLPYDSRLHALTCLGALLDSDKDDNTDARKARRALLRDPTPADYARVFEAMDATSSSSEDRVVALETLFCLADANPVAPELAGFVPRVVYQLRSRDAPAAAAAALAIVKLAEHYATLLVDNGAVQLLVDLVSAGTVKQKERAMNALSALADADANAADVAITLGVADRLVELVRSGVGEERVNAGLVLARLAQNDASRQNTVVMAGAVKPLFVLAREGVDEEICSAVFAILKIGLGNDETAQQLVADGAVAVLVTVLRSTTHTHRSCAAYAVSGITHGNRQIQTAFVKGGVLEPLLELLTAGTKYDREAAATTIDTLVAKHEANKNLAIEAGMIPTLVASVRERPTNAWAAMALGSLARKNALAKLRIVQAGALEPLVSMLREEDKDAKRTAATTLRHIAKNNESYAVEMALMGALEALVDNLTASVAGADEIGACATLRALHMLTQCQTNQETVLGLGIRDVLEDADAMGSDVQERVTRVRNNLTLQSDTTCQIM